MSFTTVAVATAVFIVLTLLWLRCRPALKRARQYMRNMSTCGFLPPPPSLKATRFLQGLSRFLTFIQVGKIRLVGRENLNISGPFVVAPNHPHYIDPAVVCLAVNRPARYMAARGVMTCLGGLGGLIAGPCGGFAADLTPGKGGPARESAVKLLTNGEVLVMFPEGWAYLDGKLETFKKGAVRIARGASTTLAKPVPIVPVHLRYGKYPGSWIRKLPPPVEYLFVFCTSWYYRRGVTAVIGKPINPLDLPADDCAATEELRRRVAALDLQS
jgi:1-acyl-sn-glycerol-3-phosphate acyltransferase